MLSSKITERMVTVDDALPHVGVLEAGVCFNPFMQIDFCAILVEEKCIRERDCVHDYWRVFLLVSLQPIICGDTYLDYEFI